MTAEKVDIGVVAPDFTLQTAARRSISHRYRLNKIAVKLLAMEQTAIGVLMILAGGIVILFTELLHKFGWTKYPVEGFAGYRRAGGIVTGSVIAFFGLLYAFHVINMK